LVLGTLRAAKADYLVTGDKDLLALAEWYPIVTPARSGQGTGNSWVRLCLRFFLAQKG